MNAQLNALAQAMIHYEDSPSRSAVLNAYEKFFRTESGKQICREMFSL